MGPFLLCQGLRREGTPAGPYGTRVLNSKLYTNMFFFHYVVFLQTSKKSLLEASRRPKPETDFRDHVAWGWPSVFSGEWSPDLD